MFRKKEIVYFIDTDSKILAGLKNPGVVPRKDEIIVLKSKEKKYKVIEVVYTLEKNQYICWIYIKEIE